MATKFRQKSKIAIIRS